MAQRRVRFTAALNSYVHDQGSEGTCYAHAVATLVVDALRRLGVPAQSAPLRSTVLEELVARFGKEGAIVPTVLDWALRTYVRPHSDEAEWLSESDDGKKEQEEGRRETHGRQT